MVTRLEMGVCRNRMTWDSNTEGNVIWITGLSGAGKSTIARATVEHLCEQSERPILIDGDDIREAIRDSQVSHDHASRLVNAYRICRLSRLLADQGHTVIVATMSIYHEIHSWNRRNFPNYFEVWVEVDLESLQSRNTKDLYSSLKNGEASNVLGLDLDYEKPINPHLVINNNPPLRSPEDLAINLLSKFNLTPEL